MTKTTDVTPIEYALLGVDMCTWRVITRPVGEDYWGLCGPEFDSLPDCNVYLRGLRAQEAERQEKIGRREVTM